MIEQPLSMKEALALNPESLDVTSAFFQFRDEQDVRINMGGWYSAQVHQHTQDGWFIVPNEPGEGSRAFPGFRWMPERVGRVDFYRRKTTPPPT